MDLADAANKAQRNLEDGDARLLAAAKDYHFAAEAVLAECKRMSGTSAAHAGRLLGAIQHLRAAHAKAAGSAS